MVDKTLILRRISELDQYLIQIREFSDISVSEYSDDWRAQRIVERTLQIMIETCLDISGHIISDEGFRTPENYADMSQFQNDQRRLVRKGQQLKFRQ